MKTILISSFILLNISLYSQNTAIPDANFEQALINLGLDTAPIDGFVPTANIDTVISLNVSNQNISVITGIEDFVALEGLYCGANPISNLNLSQNLNLKGLVCSNNFQLTSLDVSQNTQLTYLNCSLSPLLTVVDVRNGNNANFTYFDAMVDTNLTCIYVDDKNAPYLSSWIKDTTAHWVNDTLDCQNVTSLNEYNNKSNFLNIYPNPNNGIFNIAVPTAKDEVQVTIYNLSGQQIENLSLKGKGIIDINKQSSGIYFVKVIHQHKVITQKIIKY